MTIAAFLSHKYLLVSVLTNLHTKQSGMFAIELIDKFQFFPEHEKVLRALWEKGTLLLRSDLYTLLFMYGFLLIRCLI
jgi:hypothetical protein